MTVSQLTNHLQTVRSGRRNRDFMICPGYPEDFQYIIMGGSTNKNTSTISYMLADNHDCVKSRAVHKGNMAHIQQHEANVIYCQLFYPGMEVLRFTRYKIAFRNQHNHIIIHLNLNIHKNPFLTLQPGTFVELPYVTGIAIFIFKFVNQFTDQIEPIPTLVTPQHIIVVQPGCSSNRVER